MPQQYLSLQHKSTSGRVSRSWRRSAQPVSSVCFVGACAPCRASSNCTGENVEGCASALPGAPCFLGCMNDATLDKHYAVLLGISEEAPSICNNDSCLAIKLQSFEPDYCFQVSRALVSPPPKKVISFPHGLLLLFLFMYFNLLLLLNVPPAKTQRL